MRVGLSGCGRRGAAVIAQVRTHSHCDVVALHDPDPAARDRLGEATGIGLRFDDFEAMLGTGVDFVVLAGPCGDRLAQVEAAAQQGAHCLLHAPMAPDATSAAAMAAGCEKAGVQLGVVVPMLAEPVAEQLRRMLADGWLGAAAVAHALTADDEWLHAPPPQAHWRRDPLRAGSGALVQLASESLHALCWLLGRTPVRGTSLATQGTSALGEDTACAVVELRGGILCSLAASNLARGNVFSIHGTDGSFCLERDRLVLRGQQEVRGEVFDYEAPGIETAVPLDAIESASLPLRPDCELHGRFARFLDDRDDFPILGEQAAAELRVLDDFRFR